MRQPVWFRWLGVAGIELRARQQVLLIDPFLTRPPLRRLVVGRVEPDRARLRQHMSGADSILVTHAHWDHLLDVAAIAEFTGARVVGSANTCQIVAAQGVRPARIKQVDIGDRLALGPFQVEVLPGTHGRTPIDWLINGPVPRDLRPPLRLRDYRMDCCFSFRIEVEGLRLVDCPGPPTPADVLAVGTDTSATLLERLLRQVRPRVVIPVHWDNLFQPLGRGLRPMLPPPAVRLPWFRRMDPHLFARDVARLAPDTCVLVPTVFECYDLQGLVNRGQYLSARLGPGQLLRGNPGTTTEEPRLDDRHQGREQVGTDLADRDEFDACLRHGRWAGRSCWSHAPA